MYGTICLYSMQTNFSLYLSTCNNNKPMQYQFYMSKIQYQICLLSILSGQSVNRASARHCLDFSKPFKKSCRRESSPKDKSLWNPVQVGKLFPKLTWLRSVFINRRAVGFTAGISIGTAALSYRH